MVNFGKKLLENRFEPWSEYYLNYQGLKRCLERKKRRKSSALPPPPPPSSDNGSYYPQQQQQDDLSDFGSPQFRGGGGETPRIQVEGSPGGIPSGGSPSPRRQRDSSWSEHTAATTFAADTRSFETFLEDEVEKIGLFFLQIQGEIASDIGDLRKQQKALSLLGSAAAPTIPSLSIQEEGGGGNNDNDNAQNTTPTAQLHQLYTDYHSLAQLLLHLVHFVEFNVTGIRKILKKYDKNTHKHLTYQYISVPRGKNPQLKHLWTSILLYQYQGITALFMTLKVALAELKRYEEDMFRRYQLQQQLQHRNSSMGVPGTMTTSAPAAAAPSNSTNLPPPPPTSSNTHQKNTLSMPNIPLTPAELAQATAVAGTLMSSTGSTSYQRSYTPQALSSKKLYDKPASASPFRWSETEHYSISRELDAVLLKVEAARKRLDASSNTFQDMLAAQIMMNEPDMEGGDDDDDEGEDEDDGAAVDEKWFSHLLNLGSTFLYMTNYYVVAPTSGRYAKMLGGDEALAGIIIGMTPIAALVSTVLYSWWTSHSYKTALLFASTCSLIGNLFYALALPCNSLAMVMIGRLLNGFGSARSINRRYIADTFPPRERTIASAHFVTAGALGMSAGPALASILHIGYHDDNDDNNEPDSSLLVGANNTSDPAIDNNDLSIASPPINVWWTPESAPGWMMFVFWTAFWVLLWFYFEDPPKHSAPKQAPKTLELTNDAHGGDGEKQALLKRKHSDGDEEVDDDNDMEDSEREDDLPLWKNIPVMTTFVIYFVLKLVLECLLSSTATLTHYYFGWDSSISGIYLAILGLLMLPANLGIALLARNHDDRELIVFCEVFMLVGCCGVIRYTSEDSYSAIQYVFFSIIIFLSTNALEGPNMSLLSQTIPKSWSRGIFNVGLLATEAGTFGRAIGDVLLSIWSFHGMGSLLNDTFKNMSLASAVTLGMTYYFFGHMESHVKDD